MTVMIGQGIPAFREGRVWNSGAVNNSLIVTKEPWRSIQRDTKHAESVVKINDLFDSLTGSHELGTIGSHFDWTLVGAEPSSRCLVEEMEDPSGRSTSNDIMHKIANEEGGGADGLAVRNAHIGRDVFRDRPIDSIHPIMVGRGVAIVLFMWRDACANAEDAMGEITDIPTNMLKSIQVASAWAMMKMRERHDGFS